MSLLAYLTIYGPLVLKRELDLERDMPNLIPVMTLAGVVIFFSVIAATWPVWGFLTPVYLLVFFFGASLSSVFLPAGSLGNLLFWVVTVALGYLAHNLDHEPVW